MTIRSSGWKTDAIVTIPESLLLSYAWICFAGEHSFFKMYILQGGVLLSIFVGLLICVGAWLAWKKEVQKEDPRQELQRVQMLDMGENIVTEAVKDHEEEQLQWEEMIRENIGAVPLKHRSFFPILVRTFVFASIACCCFPLLHASGWLQHSWQLHGVAAVLLSIVGGWKYWVTGRNTWFGALRMLANGAILYVVVKVLFALVV